MCVMALFATGAGGDCATSVVLGLIFETRPHSPSGARAVSPLVVVVGRVAASGALMLAVVLRATLSPPRANF